MGFSEFPHSAAFPSLLRQSFQLELQETRRCLGIVTVKATGERPVYIFSCCLNIVLGLLSSVGQHGFV